MKSQVVFLLVLVAIATAQDSLIVTLNPKSPVMDSDDLVDHLANQEIEAFFVDLTNDQQSDLTDFAKDILKQLNAQPEEVSSFVANTQKFTKSIGDLIERFDEVKAEDLEQALAENPQAVLHFSRRLQEDANQDQKSQLFLNMTPSILSGLLVTLFLLITLMIGISCLYDIKTNDKFARNNLWVGKQS